MAMNRSDRLGESGLMGVLPLWKPKGMTSHDCVSRVRRLLNVKKAGHTGTLDPGVTGVLPIAVGEATKIIQFLQDDWKEYEAQIALGMSTTTQDAEGEIVAQKPVAEPIPRERILAVLKKFEGDILQTPPMFSAIKVDGKRLYEYAREGKTIERKSRRVHIKEIELLDGDRIFSGNPLRFSIRVRCSKGTYIRTLSVMIGEALGYPAHMAELVRTECAGIRRETCVSLPKLEEAAKNGEAESFFLSIEKVLENLPKWEVSDSLSARVKNGAIFRSPFDRVSGPVAVTHLGKIIAVYERHPGKPDLIKPIRVLNR